MRFPAAAAPVLAAALLAGACAPSQAPAPEPTALGPHGFRFPQGAFIAHALGGIDGHTYTNSVEALEHNLELGARFFEVDLSFTADGDLVCFHTGHEKHMGLPKPITETSTREFLAHRYDGRFTPMTLEDLLRRMAREPEAYIVTDTKHDFAMSLGEVVRVAEAVDPALVGRIVPQFYTADQWRDVARLEARHGPFATVIFTLYRTRIDDDAVVETARARRVPVITMSTKRYTPRLVERLAAIGVDSLVHTVNDRAEVESYLRRGVRGLYIDFLFPWGPEGPPRPEAAAGPLDVATPVATPR